MHQDVADRGVLDGDHASKRASLAGLDAAVKEGMPGSLHLVGERLGLCEGDELLAPSRRGLHVTITISAFGRSPDYGKGWPAIRVRWALEKVGRPYEVRLLSFASLKRPDHLARNPFGQIPTYEEGGLVLFETGAIVLHIAEKLGGLLPEEDNARGLHPPRAARTHLRRTLHEGFVSQAFRELAPV